MSYSGEFGCSKGIHCREGAMEQMNDIQKAALDDKNRLHLLTEDRAVPTFPRQRCDGPPKRRYHIQNFQITKLLKCSSEASSQTVVFEGSHENGKFALVQYTSTCQPHIPWKELDFLRRLRHPRVLPVYGAFHSVHPFLVVALCYGNLEDYHLRMTDDVKLRSITQLLDGTAFLHSKRIVHANLNMRTVLVSQSNNLLISNFRKAIQLKDDAEYESKGLHGSPAYLNLAALKLNRYSFQTDLHSCACLIFKIDAGTNLQYYAEMEQTRENYTKVVEEGYPIKEENTLVFAVKLTDRVDCSNHKDILKKMLSGKEDAGFLLDEFVGAHRLKSANLCADEESGNALFAIQHSMEALYVSPAQKPAKFPKLADFISSRFYYDSRDDAVSKICNASETPTDATLPEFANQVQELILTAKSFDPNYIERAKKSVRSSVGLGNLPEKVVSSKNQNASNDVRRLNPSQQMVNKDQLETISANDLPGPQCSTTRKSRPATPPAYNAGPGPSTFTFKLPLPSGKTKR